MHADTRIRGTLHVAVAFDWGEEIDLAKAATLGNAEPQTFPRRKRTPTSVVYRPPPLLVRLAATSLTLPDMGHCLANTDATVFDFGATSLAFRIPWELTMSQLSQLASCLADSEYLVHQARQVVATLFEQMRPAIKGAALSEIHEEFFTFQLDPGSTGMPPAQLITEHGDWLAGLVRLEDQTLSVDEVAEALRMRMSYTPHDLVVIEWAAAVVVDKDCEETLHTIEFANLQLLEYRFIDQQVDEALQRANRLIHPLAKSGLPTWYLHTRSLRALGDMRIDTVVLFERASSTLKLVGDQYLARLYRQLAARFRLEEWAQGIRQSLDETQGVYETLSGQSSSYRVEVLEVIIVMLILFEIVMALI